MRKFAAQSLHSVGHGLGKVGAQEGKVSRFAEVQLDRRKLIFKINLLNARRAHQFIQFVQQADANLAAHVGEIDF
ncbi:MAG: hypothetical protein ACLSAH_22910 [Bilophila wadsworthia]